MGHFGRNVCHFTNCIRAGFFPIKNPLESGVVIYSDQFRIWGCLTFCFVKVICTDRDFIKSIRDVECVIRGICKLFHDTILSQRASYSGVSEIGYSKAAISENNSKRISNSSELNVMDLFSIAIFSHKAFAVPNLRVSILFREIEA